MPEKKKPSNKSRFEGLASDDFQNFISGLGLLQIVDHCTQIPECPHSPKMSPTVFVEFWGLPPLILFFNTSTGWFGRFVLSTECYRTRKLDYNDLNWPRCSAQVTESLALTDGGFCQKQTLYILDYVPLVSL